MTTDLKIAIIEDNPGDEFLLKELLLDLGLKEENISSASNLHHGLTLTQNTTYDCIFLDLNLPDSEGFETVNSMIEQAQNTSIIVLTGHDDFNIGLKAVGEGVQDYIQKNQLNRASLHKSISFALERTKIRNQAKRQHQLLQNLNYQLAHDVKAPLSRIKQLVLLIQQEQDLPTKESYLDLMMKVVEQAYEQVIEMLEVGSTSHNLRELVNRLYETLLSEPEKEKIDLRKAILHTEYLFNFKGKYLHSILHNLMSNAFKYLDLQAENPFVAIETQDYRNGILLKVIDNGSGISEERMPYIFEMGAKDDSNPSSTGMGLNLVREIVQVHGGSLQVYSKLGAGTEVEIYLPSTE